MSQPGRDSALARLLCRRLVGEALFGIAVLALGAVLATVFGSEASEQEKTQRVVILLAIGLTCFVLHRYRKALLRRHRY